MLQQGKGYRTTNPPYEIVDFAKAMMEHVNLSNCERMEQNQKITNGLHDALRRLKTWKIPQKEMQNLLGMIAHRRLYDRDNENLPETSGSNCNPFIMDNDLELIKTFMVVLRIYQRFI